MDGTDRALSQTGGASGQRGGVRQQYSWAPSIKTTCTPWKNQGSGWHAVFRRGPNSTSLSLSLSGMEVFVGLNGWLLGCMVLLCHVQNHLKGGRGGRGTLGRRTRFRPLGARTNGVVPRVRAPNWALWWDGSWHLEPGTHGSDTVHGSVSGTMTYSNR